MRKVLLGVIMVLLIVLGINMIAQGVGFFNFNIQSLGQIEDSSKALKTKIEDANRLIDTDYPNKLNDLTTAENSLQTAKKEYLEYVNKSSNEQIIAAKTLKSYAIEFLWTKLGTHAREEGVNLTFEVGSGGNSGGSTLNFTVDGSYIAITNFIYSIENDTDLDFRIQNFKLLPHQGEILEATFSVSGVTIKGNTSAESSSSTATTTTQDDSSKSNNSSNTNTVDNNSKSTSTNTANQ